MMNQDIALADAAALIGSLGQDALPFSEARAEIERRGHGGGLFASGHWDGVVRAIRSGRRHDDVEVVLGGPSPDLDPPCNN